MSSGRNGEKRMSEGQVGAEQRLVTPGMVIGPLTGMRVGSGAIVHNDEIIATKVGWVKHNNNVVSVDAINHSYIPRSGDLVVGIVAEVRNNLWFLNINGSFQGLLPMSLAPWKVEFGHARKHMDVGDCVLARVQEVDECHNVVLTMKGVGLRRLSQGAVVEVPVNHLDRIRGENNSNLDRMKDTSDCRIIVGENGRVWIDGDDSGISWTREALAIAKQQGHKKNFDSIMKKHEKTF